MSQIYCRRLTVSPSYFLILHPLLFPSKCKQSLHALFSDWASAVRQTACPSCWKAPGVLFSFLAPCVSITYLCANAPQQGFLGGLLKIHFSLLASAPLTSSAGFAREILQVWEASPVCALTFQLVYFQPSTFISSNPHQLCQPSPPYTVPLTHLRCLHWAHTNCQGPCYF